MHCIICSHNIHIYFYDATELYDVEYGCVVYVTHQPVHRIHIHDYIFESIIFFLYYQHYTKAYTYVVYTHGDVHHICCVYVIFFFKPANQLPLTEGRKGLVFSVYFFICIYLF